MDLTKMAAITELSEEDFYATVQPGVTRKTLNHYLRDTGLWFPIGKGSMWFKGTFMSFYGTSLFMAAIFKVSLMDRFGLIKPQK